MRWPVLISGFCFAAVSFGGESVLYPGGALKEDEYCFAKKKAACNDSSSRGSHSSRPQANGSSDALLARTLESNRGECVERRCWYACRWRPRWHSKTTRAANLGTGATTAISICTDGRSTASRRYSTTRRKSKASTWSWCRNAIRRSRVRRAVPWTTISALNARTVRVEACDTVANADVKNGAEENIRQKVLPSLATDGGDRDNGWLAQPAVHLFDRSEAVSPTRTGREPRTVISQLSGAVPWDSASSGAGGSQKGLTISS